MSSPTKRVASDNDLVQKSKEAPQQDREAAIVLAIGEKGVGKTFTTMNYFTKFYIKTVNGKRGRKVLIFDTNNEFQDIDPIRFEDVKLFQQQQVIEIRRILAGYDPKTFKPLGIDGKETLLEALLEIQTPRDMALLLEDLNSYIIGATSKRIIDVLTTNRHKSLDIFIHLQTFRAVPPRIWGNINIMRLHKTGDDVDQIKGKVRNFPLTKVANMLVQTKTKTDKRFFVYINYDEVKITGNFELEELVECCRSYLLVNQKRVITGEAMVRHGRRYTDEQFNEILNSEARELALEYSKQ